MKKVVQAGIVETCLSDHQLIFCTRRIKRAKPNKHNDLTFRSMKNFLNEIYEEALGKLAFPDCENFGCVNKAYSDPTLKIFDVVRKVAPTKTIRVKNNANEWFDREIAEKIAARGKLFRKFRKSKLNVDKILYKEARNTVQALIKDKKTFARKTIWKYRKTNKALENYKKIGFTRQKGSHNKHMPQYEKWVDIFSKNNRDTFKKHFANLASDVVKKLSDPIGKIGIPSVRQYYKEVNFREKKI